jgi:hypothetical protein
MTYTNVVTKSEASDVFGNDKVNDQPVVTKSLKIKDDQPVVTKKLGDEAFGNDAAMFVRVRKRTLSYGTSASYDLVHAVRINGKPRQKFLLGLGSLKNPPEYENRLCWFWHYALCKMRRHGLSETKQKTIVESMIAKGATKPTREQCWHHVDGFGWEDMHFNFSVFYPGCVSKITEEECNLRHKALAASLGISLS